MDKRKLFERCFRQLMLQMRRESLYTQKSLSATSGLSRQFISQLETGLRGPSFETFCKLAWGLGLTPAKLLERFMAIYEQEMGKGMDEARDSEAAEYIRNLKENVSK